MPNNLLPRELNPEWIWSPYDGVGMFERPDGSFECQLFKNMTEDDCRDPDGNLYKLQSSVQVGPFKKVMIEHATPFSEGDCRACRMFLVAAISQFIRGENININFNNMIHIEGHPDGESFIVPPPF